MDGCRRCDDIYQGPVWRRGRLAGVDKLPRSQIKSKYSQPSFSDYTGLALQRRERCGSYLMEHFDPNAAQHIYSTALAQVPPSQRVHCHFAVD
ncbi:hypothetical protein ACQRIT_007992 [Beauveria bassiana]